MEEELDRGEETADVDSRDPDLLGVKHRLLLLLRLRPKAIINENDCL